MTTTQTQPAAPATECRHESEIAVVRVRRYGVLVRVVYGCPDCGHRRETVGIGR